MLQWTQSAGPRERQAAKLNRGLVGITRGSVADMLHSPQAQASVLTSIVGQVVTRFKPNGPGSCDHNWLERALNILTSVPYGLVGIHALR